MGRRREMLIVLEGALKFFSMSVALIESVNNPGLMCELRGNWCLPMLSFAAVDELCSHLETRTFRACST